MDQERTLNDILEIVGYLKDNMVTRDEHRQSLFELRSDIMSHVDSFIGLHQKLDIELAALRAKSDRLEGFVKQLAAHANIKLEF
ncbi:hypothetical protein CO174_02505 [Candidatus Uhrbacteria bacterium CG_4_9_14_3_um_filter_50_9]|uniref:Uncharacterized protein n=1 Tax=Candidatus Uhrbacteria bacterium CG_4_9_14_3_um_filter_50_9 TaxID=1975035 RepID=A0A2M7XCX0_9BACT|nr:MAG: hypothetical protein CO174_02505 [Candidatus Uhrbacteria bacterium CG_4_9_14_3_um_filter_50_9]